MAVKHGRFGAFLGCTRFPECRTTRPLVKEIGVACPLCEKPVVERKTKTGRLFYGCSDYPACNFISWNKPTGELCPVCGAFLVEKKYKNQPAAAECSNAECPTRQGNSKPADVVKDQEKPKKITKPAKPAVDKITRHQLPKEKKQRAVPLINR
jgi:DNA topoisomerase-1